MSGGGGPSGRPRLAIDHVQVAVEDLRGAAARLLREHGLVALPGGRHPFATANMIVPLGSGYLELIAVVEPAEIPGRPGAERVATAVREGRSFAVWVARTDDLQATRAQLLGQGFDLPEPAPGARIRPDGVRLEWRMQELVADARPSPLPFLIEWRVPPGQHPADQAVEHPSGARRIASVTLSDPRPEQAREALRRLLGDDVDYKVVAGEPGVAEVVVDTAAGRLVLT